MKVGITLKKSNLPNKLIPYTHDTIEKRLKEGLFIVLEAIAVFLFAAFFSYNNQDPGWSRTGSVQISNKAGAIGAWLSDLILYLFGYIGYLLPVILAIYGVYIFYHRSKSINTALFMVKAVAFMLAIFGGCAFINMHAKPISTLLPSCAGGIIGSLLSDYFIQLLHPLGASLLFMAAFLTGITIASGLSWLALSKYLVAVMINFGKFIYFLIKSMLVRGYFKAQLVKKFMAARELAKAKVIKPVAAEQSNLAKYHKKNLISPNFSDPANVEDLTANELADDFAIAEAPKLKTNIFVKQAKNIEKLEPKLEPNIIVKTNTLKSSKEDKSLVNIASKVNQHPSLPAMDLLEQSELAEKDAMQWSATELAELSRTLEQKLLDFGINAKVTAVYPGPVITRFELELAPGVKASKITSLSKDLARSLSLVSVRVVEVIPGKSVVGLEIPNQHREIVRLRELIESRLYQESAKAINLVLGKDIAGEPVIVDLAKMPHLLIAGTTGSGKSVAVNALLLSMLYQSTSDELRLILIDPKMLELSIYEGIPHLLTPVVTDMKDAAYALKWCVAEMERRYQLMAAVGVRNLLGFNKKVQDGNAHGKPLFDPFFNKIATEEEPPILQPLPYIVVVIDEFADMIMVVGKKVEELIARIAQKARAAGIHLILATQRPSVDVITGLIKANIPTRIAFQVSSKIDSRTILDQQGAEQLLGCGDMLYLAPGAGIPKRVHGAFVSDDEVHAVVRSLKQNNPSPNYIKDFSSNSFNANSLSSVDLFDAEEEQDPLYDEAVFIVTKTRKSSVSNLQRRLKIGYNRAARLVEDMESAGIVSAMNSNGNREVLAPEPVEN